MKLRNCTFVAAVALIAATLPAADEPSSPAEPQVTADAHDTAPPQDPFDIDGAIARGLQRKRTIGLPMEDGWRAGLAALSGRGATGYRLLIQTPEMWVQSRAAGAAEKYMKFVRADLTEDDVAPILRVMVSPSVPVKMTDRNEASGVKHVVVRDVKGTDAVQPIKLEPFTDSVSNLFGATLTYGGAMATFPLSEVERISKMSPAGDFLITVVGDNYNKDFRLHDEHLKVLRIGARVWPGMELSRMETLMGKPDHRGAFMRQGEKTARNYYDYGHTRVFYADGKVTDVE